MSYALLPLSPAAFAEIKTKMELALYQHAISHDGHRLNLTGLAACEMDNDGRDWERRIGYVKPPLDPALEEQLRRAVFNAIDEPGGPTTQRLLAAILPIIAKI